MSRPKTLCSEEVRRPHYETNRRLVLQICGVYAAIPFFLIGRGPKPGPAYRIELKWILQNGHLIPALICKEFCHRRGRTKDFMMIRDADSQGLIDSVFLI